MAAHLAHALLLAGFLGLSLFLLVGRSLRVPSDASAAREILFLDGRAVKTRRAALGAFAVLVLAAIALLASGEGNVSQGSPEDGRLAFTLISTSVLGLLVTPFQPAVGPVVYLVLSYLFPREHRVTLIVMQSGVLSWVAALSLIGTLLWHWRTNAALVLSRSVLFWYVSAFAAWVGVAIVGAVVTGPPPHSELTLRATRYVHAVAIFTVMATCRLGVYHVRTVALAMGVVLAVRLYVLAPSWLMEQNVAMLVVITVPVVLASATHRPVSILQLVLAPLGAYLAMMVVAIQNRGAVLGLAAALSVLWMTSRRRWTWFVVTTLVGIPGALWALRAGLFDRFWQIYAHGTFLGSAAERLETWRGGLGIALDHWLIGVGPGNFVVVQNTYAHNSLVEVLVEMGVVGLALYAAMFVVALWQLHALLRSAPSDWRRGVARGLMSAFAAHLVAGSFFLNTNLVWTYALLGIAASVTSRSDA